MMKNYESLGCCMSLKLHFMDSHLNFFPENKCDVSDEHGKRFYQEISEMECRFKGKPSPSLLADYCWTLVREIFLRLYRQVRMYLLYICTCLYNHVICTCCVKCGITSTYFTYVLVIPHFTQHVHIQSK